MATGARLLLLRHEEAHPAGPGGDGERALTPRGRARMLRQARTLADAHPVVDHVFTSPLVRAVQTAEIWLAAGGLGSDTPVSAHGIIALGATPRELLALADGVPSPNGLVGLVGHEPTLSTFLFALVPDCPVAAFSTGQAVLVGPPTSSGARSIEAAYRDGQVMFSAP